MSELRSALDLDRFTKLPLVLNIDSLGLLCQVSSAGARSSRFLGTNSGPSSGHVAMLSRSYVDSQSGATRTSGPTSDHSHPVPAAASVRRNPKIYRRYG